MFLRFSFSLFSKLNYNASVELQSNVYFINCLQCGTNYIGQSKRYIKTRMKEHRYLVDNAIKKQNICKDGRSSLV